VQCSSKLRRSQLGFNEDLHILNHGLVTIGKEDLQGGIPTNGGAADVTRLMTGEGEDKDDSPTDLRMRTENTAQIGLHEIENMTWNETLHKYVKPTSQTQVLFVRSSVPPSSTAGSPANLKEQK